ncbi:MAG: replication-relaxation family protein [Dehalococcoidia bacterium]
MNHAERGNHDDDVRYVLTEQGMRFLAARAGVPPSTFGEHGAVTYVKEADQGHPERAVRHLEHTLGLNRFMVGLARDARACGWVLAEWRNEAESTCRFVDESGRPAWIRPDASGLVGIGDERVPFLVEYDRGTLDAGDYAGKFAGYRRYYASEAWRTATVTQEPALLFVCADDRAALRVSGAAARGERRIPLLITTESRSARHGSNPDGCVGAVWQQQVAGGELVRWPSAPEPGGGHGG